MMRTVFLAGLIAGLGCGVSEAPRDPEPLPSSVEDVEAEAPPRETPEPARAQPAVEVVPSGPDARIAKVGWGQTVLLEKLRLVAGKEAMMRVVVLCDTAGVPAPPMMAVVHGASGQLGTLKFDKPTTLPTAETTRPDLTLNYRTTIPAAWVEPGMRIEVQLDPEKQQLDKDRSNNTLNVIADVGVGTVLELTVIPVVHAGTTGLVPDFASSLFRAWPLKQTRAETRAPFTFSGQLIASNAGAWSTLLDQLAQARQSDGSRRYYYGFVRVNYTSGVGGIGYVGRPIAVGRDNLSATSTMAHELGHNFGRDHAPCGTSGDANYPYSQARIGSFGYDLPNKAVVSNSAFDIMSYCEPKWISDYTYQRVQRFLELRPPQATSRTGAQVQLLISGRLGDEGASLYSVHRIEAPPPDLEIGTGRLRVLGDEGEAEVSFEAVRFPEGEQRSFTALVPDVGAVQQVEVWEGDQLLLRKELSAKPNGWDPRVKVEERNGSIHLRWNAEQFPHLLVAHVGSKRTTLATQLEGGEAVLPVTGLESGGTFELSLSHGPDALRVQVPRAR